MIQQVELACPGVRIEVGRRGITVPRSECDRFLGSAEEDTKAAVQRVQLCGVASAVAKAERMFRDALRDSNAKFGKYTCAQCGRWWTTAYLVKDGRATWSECQGCRARCYEPEGAG